MPSFCAVFGCSNRHDREKDKSYFRLPKEITHQGDRTQQLSKARREKWLSNIGRADIKPSSYSNIRICSDHFINKPAVLYDELNPDWAPTVNMGQKNMDDSDLYMQCDEDDLEPCQSITENRDQRYNKVTVVQSGNNAPTPAQSDGASERTSAATDLMNQAVPLVSAPAVTLLPNAVQPAGAALGQTIYISAQSNPGQHLAGPMSLGTSLGYIFNGQPISFLTAAQTPQLITQRMVTPSVQQTTPGKLSTLQIPVTLTINSSSNLQSITSSAPGVSNLNVTPSNVLPATAAPGGTIKVIKFTKLPGAPAAVGQVMSSLMQSTKTVTIQNNVTSIAPAPLLSAGTSQTARPQVSATTNALKRASSSARFCVCCKAFYQKSQSLRGFFCQCNQGLLKSLQDLKVQAKKRTKRSSDKTQSKPSRSETPVSFSTSSETSLRHVTTSEIPEGVPSPRSGDFDDQGRMIVLVEDFFYGQHPGQPTPRTNLGPITMKCQLCDKKMKGNIKLMNHMKHHMELDQQTGEVDGHTMCHHCLRDFKTPFSLQCHVETVHNQAESSKVCKICEWSFENEPLFLNHMKQTHKPGEMPYMCQVCEFRSSFYQDVISHFSEQHKDTCILLCPYCLKIFRSCAGFQLHYTRHQNRAAHHCSKCRLQFTREKDEFHHRQRFHKTCVKPKQLEGLTPGTRVIIRAYARSTDNRDHPLKTCSNATTTAARQNFTSKVIPVKKKPVESMMELMVKFESQCKPTEKHYCMECTYDIPYFSNHFPTYVSCSLCRYCTCCSRAYANHMISVHVPRKSTRKYIALYKPCPKKGRLTCTTCRFKTRVGDSMAKHLADYPTHQASRSTLQEGFSRGYKRFVFIPTDLLRGGQILNNAFFLPLQVKQMGSSLPLSSKPLPPPRFTITLPASPARTASFPIKVQHIEQSAIADKNPAAKPDASKQSSNGGRCEFDTGRTAESSLTSVQLKVVLYALCCGVPQAANHFHTPPEEVQALLLKRQSQLEPSRRREGLTPQAADRLIEWVLCQREQQLPIDEANLFDFMSSHGAQEISYDSVVDFLLRHDLGLQAFATSSKLLPDKSQELEGSFNSFLKNQVNSQTFRLCSMAAMDELSIFVDVEQLKGASVVSSSMLSALKLVGTTNPLIEVVFTALADGTLLPTMLFLRAEPLEPDAHSLPDFIIMEARPQGFTDEERLQLWFDKVWRQHVNPSSGGKGLLIIDTYKGHTSNEFLAALNSANTLPGLIPRSCSRRLQPLEACMGPVLREFLQARWSDYVTTASQDLVGAKPADLALLLSRWLVEVLHVLNAEPKLLFRSFDRVLGTSPGMAFDEPSELVRSLTEALLVGKLQADKAEEKKAETSSAESWPSPQSSLLSLKKIFEKDSDVESFLGFEDSEIMDHCSSKMD